MAEAPHIPPESLANRTIFESSDLNFVREQVSRYFKPHRMQFCDSGDSELRTSLRRVTIGQTALSLLQYGGNVMIDPGKMEEFFLVHVTLAGESRISYGNGRMTFGQRDVAVITPNKTHCFWWRPETRVLAIQIPRRRLLAHLRDVCGVAPSDGISFDFRLDLDAPQAQGFSQLLDFLLADASNPNGLSADPVTAAPLENALLTALLKLQPGSHFNAMAAASGAPAPGYIKRAEIFMRNNLHRPIKLDELAKVSGVTERTLINGFQRFRGATPARYFLSLRLGEARRKLCEGEADATVSDIAFELGFHHLSGFAAAYRRLYDEPPSQTLRDHQRIDV